MERKSAIEIVGEMWVGVKRPIWELGMVDICGSDALKTDIKTPKNFSVMDIKTPKNSPPCSFLRMMRERTMEGSSKSVYIKTPKNKTITH